MDQIKIRALAINTGISYAKLLAFFSGKNNLKVSELKTLLPWLFSLGATVDHQQERVETLIKLHETV